MLSKNQNASTEFFVLQDFVSRPESLKRKLSQDSWQRGVGSFFCDNVPFAYSTGLEFASQLGELVSALYKAKEDALVVTEIGAGLGFLTKHLADVLYERNPETAKKITFCVSDSTEILVKQMQESPLFQVYRDQIQFEVIDVASPEFKKIPDFVMMAYVLDSVPTRHICLKNGELFELKIQSKWSTSKPYFDTTQVPPKRLSIEEIKALIEGPFTNKKRVGISCLAQQIFEAYTLVPLEESTLSEQEKQELKNFVSFLDKKESRLFNFSFETMAAIKALVTSGVTCVGIYDVGQKAGVEFPEELCGSYGATQFYPLYIPLLEYVATQFGYKVLKSPFPQEHGQLTVVCKEAYVEALAPIFNAVMTKEGGEESRIAAEKIQALPLERETFNQDVEAILNSLSDEEQKSHTLLMSLAIAYKRRKQFDIALKYAQQVINLYGKIAVSTWHLIGEIYYYKGKYQEALHAIQTAIDVSPDYVGAYHVQSLVYTKLNDVELAKRASEKVVMYSGITPLGLSHLYTIALLELSQKNRDRAKHILQWIQTEYAQNPDLFSEAYMKQITTCYKEFFRFGIQNAPPPK